MVVPGVDDAFWCVQVRRQSDSRSVNLDKSIEVRNVARTADVLGLGRRLVGVRCFLDVLGELIFGLVFVDGTGRIVDIVAVGAPPVTVSA